MVEGYVRKQKNDYIIRHNQNAWLAWHTAALTRCKEMPELEKLFIDEKDLEPKKEQTTDQMIAMVRLINAAWGGEEVEVHG
jgi:hypothetical protein